MIGALIEKLRPGEKSRRHKLSKDPFIETKSNPIPRSNPVQTNTQKVQGLHLLVFGNFEGLWGDVSGLRGDVTGLSGNATNIFGDVTRLPRLKEGDIDISEAINEVLDAFAKNLG